MTNTIYCYYISCKNEKCERHVANIEKSYGENKFGIFDDCPDWDLPEIYFTPRQEKSQE